MKTCKHCKEKFNETSHAQLFCTIACRRKAYAPKMKIIADRNNHNRWNKYAPGKIQCPICQGWYRQICSHAYGRHKILNNDFKELLGRDTKRGLLERSLYIRKRDIAIENGTALTGKEGKKYRFVPGDKRAGRYERSEETKERIRKLNTFKKQKKYEDKRI